MLLDLEAQVCLGKANAQLQVEILRQIDGIISAGCHRPEGGTKLFIMAPNLNVSAFHELVETASVVEVKVAEDAG